MKDSLFSDVLKDLSRNSDRNSYERTFRYVSVIRGEPAPGIVSAVSRKIKLLKGEALKAQPNDLTVIPTTVY